MGNETTEESRSSKSKLLIIVIIAAVVVIAVLVGVIFYLMRGQEEPERDEISSEVRGVIVTEDNLDEVLSEPDVPPEAKHYVCKMNVEWHFEDAGKPSYDAYVANSTENTYTVYFDVLLKDSGEMVYTSPYMPVGSELDEIQLTSVLDTGTYPAVVKYHLVDEDKSELSSVSVTVTLFIEN